MKINGNDRCRVVLTRAGCEAIENDRADIREQLEKAGVLKNYSPGDPWEGQLWEAMRIFGPLMFIGTSKQPFKSNEIDLI